MNNYQLKVIQVVGGDGHGYGQRDGQFYYPRCIALDSSQNRFFVTDANNHRVQVFDAATNQFLFKFGQEGNGNGEFNYPTGICVATVSLLNGNDEKEERIYICDQDNHRVQVFNNQGSRVQFLFTFGSYGLEYEHFHWPQGIAIYTRHGCVFVADSVNKRISVWSTQGKYVTSIIVQGDPCEVCVDESRGRLLVGYSSFCNSQVKIFALPFSLISTIGSKGSHPAQFHNPRGICCDGNGNIFVADFGNHRVQMFDVSGQFLYSIGSQGDRLGQFNWPWGVCYDRHRHRLLLVETINHRISIIQVYDPWECTLAFLHGIVNHSIVNPILFDAFMSDILFDRFVLFSIFSFL